MHTWKTVVLIAYLDGKIDGDAYVSIMAQLNERGVA